MIRDDGEWTLNNNRKSNDEVVKIFDDAEWCWQQRENSIPESKTLSTIRSSHCQVVVAEHRAAVLTILDGSRSVFAQEKEIKWTKKTLVSAKFPKFIDFFRWVIYAVVAIAIGRRFSTRQNINKNDKWFDDIVPDRRTDVDTKRTIPNIFIFFFCFAIGFHSSAIDRRAMTNSTKIKIESKQIPAHIHERCDTHNISGDVY